MKNFVRWVLTIRKKREGTGFRVDAHAEVCRAAWREDLGRKRNRQGQYIHVYSASSIKREEFVANELVLIIEDNEKNRKLIRDLLQAKGYQTIESETAEDGLKSRRKETRSDPNGYPTHWYGRHHRDEAA